MAEVESETWTPVPKQFLVARQATEHEKIAGVDWIRRNVVRQPPLTALSILLWTRCMYSMYDVYSVHTLPSPDDTKAFVLLHFLRCHGDCFIRDRRNANDEGDGG